MFQNAATNISIPGWRRVARVYFGPERQNTTNVAACGFTTAANTYAVVANCSRKENGTHADCSSSRDDTKAKTTSLTQKTLNHSDSSPSISPLGFVYMLCGKADKEYIVIFCTSMC